MSINENNKQNILPIEILDLKEDYNKIAKLAIEKKYAEIDLIFAQNLDKNPFDYIFNSVTRVPLSFLGLSNKKNEIEGLSNKDLVTVFIRKLIESIKWHYFYKNDKELAQKFTTKLADIVAEYGGYRTICGDPYNTHCINFWKVYNELNKNDRKKIVKFMGKINEEIKSIVESENQNSIKKLLPKICFILNFFYSMNDESKEMQEQLDKITNTSLNLLIKEKYKLESLPGSGLVCSPLTQIFQELDSKETKNLIMKYLIEYTDYFQKINPNNRECVINVVYPGKNKRSDVFGMYLENALLLEKEDLYAGKTLDKVWEKLFLYEYGDISLEDFTETLLVIEQICQNSNYFKLLLDSTFFNKINKTFKNFRKSNLDSQYEYLGKEVNKMKLRFLRLYITIQKQQLVLNKKTSQKSHMPKRYIRKNNSTN